MRASVGSAASLTFSCDPSLLFLPPSFRSCWPSPCHHVALPVCVWGGGGVRVRVPCMNDGVGGGPYALHGRSRGRGELHGPWVMRQCSGAHFSGARMSQESP